MFVMKLDHARAVECLHYSTIESKKKLEKNKVDDDDDDDDGERMQRDG